MDERYALRRRGLLRLLTATGRNKPGGTGGGGGGGAGTGAVAMTTADYLNYAPGSKYIANANSFLVAFSFYLNESAANQYTLLEAAEFASVGATSLYIRVNTTKTISVDYADTAGTPVQATSVATVSALTWYTLVACRGSAGTLLVYIRPSGGSWSSLITSPTSGTILGVSHFGINCHPVALNGQRPIWLHDVWAAWGQSLDLTVSSNLDKFLPTASKGATGATPTGSQPDYFLSGGPSGWATNKGSRPNLTVNGTLTNATSNPA